MIHAEGGGGREEKEEEEGDAGAKLAGCACSFDIQSVASDHNRRERRLVSCVVLCCRVGEEGREGGGVRGWGVGRSRAKEEESSPKS